MAVLIDRTSHDCVYTIALVNLVYIPNHDGLYAHPMDEGDFHLTWNTGGTTNVIFVPPRRVRQQHINLSLLGYYICFSDHDKDALVNCYSRKRRCPEE